MKKKKGKEPAFPSNRIEAKAPRCHALAPYYGRFDVHANEVGAGGCYTYRKLRGAP